MKPYVGHLPVAETSFDGCGDNSTPFLIKLCKEVGIWFDAFKSQCQIFNGQKSLSRGLKILAFQVGAKLKFSSFYFENVLKKSSKKKKPISSAITILRMIEQVAAHTEHANDSKFSGLMSVRFFDSHLIMIYLVCVVQSCAISTFSCPPQLCLADSAAPIKMKLDF